MKLDSINLLCGGVILTTLGFAAILWHTDSRTAAPASTPAAVAGLRQEPAPSPELPKPDTLSAPEAPRPGERSILPVTRKGGSTPDFDAMPLSQRVEVFQQRHREFMTERMAALLPGGTCCHAGAHDHADR